MTDNIKALFFSTSNICGLEYWYRDQAHLEKVMNEVYIKYIITKETTLSTIDFVRAMNTELIQKVASDEPHC
jgi:hypothetical protein